jgi:hypothetical protein
MARVIKHCKTKKSRFWTAGFASRDNRQLKCSNKMTCKNQATEIAWNLGAANAGLWRDTHDNSNKKKVLDNVSKKVTGDTFVWKIIAGFNGKIDLS